MAEQIRLRNPKRLYDFAYRLYFAISNCRKQGKYIATFVPYDGAKKHRSVAVDAVPYPGFGKKLPRGVNHMRTGALLQVTYKCMHEPTEEQKRQAERAVRWQKIPRKRLTGRLVDVFLHKGSLYWLLMDVQERDADRNRKYINYRLLNLDGGDLQMAAIDVTKQVRKTKSPAKKKGFMSKAGRAIARRRQGLKKKTGGKKVK